MMWVVIAPLIVCDLIAVAILGGLLWDMVRS